MIQYWYRILRHPIWVIINKMTSTFDGFIKNHGDKMPTMYDIN